MRVTIAFDVYGTLIDPFGVVSRLADFVGARAPALAGVWRDKQIEYLFRRALGRDYVPFATCTRQALDYTCQYFGVDLSSANKLDLLAGYRQLPAYPGVVDALRRLQDLGCSNYAFSNGEPADLEALLESAGLDSLLAGIVSVHDARSYKPDPLVYAHFLKQTAATVAQTWLVSANTFDVIGAQSCGWRTAWLRREPDAVFDPWGIEPTLTVNDIAGLVGQVC